MGCDGLGMGGGGEGITRRLDAPGPPQDPMQPALLRLPVGNQLYLFGWQTAVPTWRTLCGGPWGRPRGQPNGEPRPGAQRPPHRDQPPPAAPHDHHRHRSGWGGGIGWVRRGKGDGPGGRLTPTLRGRLVGGCVGGGSVSVVGWGWCGSGWSRPACCRPPHRVRPRPLHTQGPRPSTRLWAVKHQRGFHVPSSFFCIWLKEKAHTEYPQHSICAHWQCARARSPGGPGADARVAGDGGLPGRGQARGEVQHPHPRLSPPRARLPCPGGPEAVGALGGVMFPPPTSTRF